MEAPWLRLSLTGDPEAEGGRGAPVLSCRGLRGQEAAPGSEPPGSPGCLDEGTGPHTACACPPGGPRWESWLPQPPCLSAALDSRHPSTWAPSPPSRGPSNHPGMEGSGRRENLLYTEQSHTPGGTHRSTQRHTHTHTTRTYPHHTHSHVPAHHTHTHTHMCPRAPGGHRVTPHTLKVSW